MRPLRRLPPQASELATAWKADDRRWFEQRPGALVRLRPPAPGELETMPVEFGTGITHTIEAARALAFEHRANRGRLVVAVVALGPGLRTRFLGASFVRRGKALARLFLPWGEQTVTEVDLAGLVRDALPQLQQLAAGAAERAARRREEGDACALCGEAFGAIAVTLAVSLDHEAPRSVCLPCGKNLDQLAAGRPVSIVALGVYLDRASSDELAKPNPSPALLEQWTRTKAAAAAMRDALATRGAA